MRLSSFFIVTFSIGVISYPAMHIPIGNPFVAGNEIKGRQAEPVPRPESKPKTDYAVLQGEDSLEKAATQKDYRIIINIPATRLFVLENGAVVRDFPIAVGSEIYKTPTGKDELTQLIWNPWWHPPKSEWAKDEKVTPPGPKNPLGPVKMLLKGDIRMHGTTKDSSIGTAASHGCIRMHSSDAIKLAWFLQSQMTDKNDPALLDKYKKNASTSFWVKFDKAIPVDIVYDPVAFVDEAITIYPDLYGKVKDVKELAQWKMFMSGVDPWAFNTEDLPVPKKRLSQTVNIHDIRTE